MSLTFNHILIPLQVCCYAISPNSNFLFSELEIILLFPDIPGALRAPGCLQSKNVKYKSIPFWVPLYLCFLEKVQIPTFYLVNLKSSCFSRTFLGPYGPRVAPQLKMKKRKVYP